MSVTPLPRGALLHAHSLPPPPSLPPSHLEKQNPSRAPHYLFANEEKGRWAAGDLIAPSSLPPFFPSSLPSVRLSNAPIRKARGPRKKRWRAGGTEAGRGREGGREGGRGNGTREILFRLNRDWNSHLSRAVSAPQHVPPPPPRPAGPST